MATAAERQASYKARMRAQGYAQVADWVPTDRREFYREVAKALRAGENVTIGEVTSNPEPKPEQPGKVDWEARFARWKEAQTREREKTKPAPGAYWAVIPWWTREEAKDELLEVEVYVGPRGGLRARFRSPYGGQMLDTRVSWREKTKAWGLRDHEYARLHRTREEAEHVLHARQAEYEELHQAFRNALGGAPKADARDLLGVSAGASADEIKAAWQRFASKHHPDKGGDPEQFKRGRAAYEVLVR